MPDRTPRPRPPVATRTTRRLPFIHFAVDSAIWLITIPLTTFLRYDFSFEQTTSKALAIACMVAVVGQGLFGVTSGLYRRRWRYGSFDEVFALSLTVLFAGLSLELATMLAPDVSIPRSVPLLATTFTAAGTVSMRSLWRLYKLREQGPPGGESIVIIGAGNGAYQVVRALLADDHSPYRPVAMLDDDPHKRNLRLSGVPVEGTLDDLAKVAAQRNAQHALMAIPTADSELIGHMAHEAKRAGLHFLVLPAAKDMFGSVSLSDIRPVMPADLLGRHPADIDTCAVSHYITGKRVLVTGAGGSIGSELCRQLHQLAPAALVMLDRDESGLHGVQLSIDGRALLDDPNLVLADIRDRDRMFEVFRHHQPEVVFHAAALKHLPLLEAHPEEGWKTNVLGTQNVLDAASAVNAERVVNISTDKAANPTSVLGYTKRITERLTAQQGRVAQGTYVSVRFGNVLGSRGSMLITFAAQADSGGPITVTHPDVTRYFMTIEEAVRLSIYAGAIGPSGETLVLDMGEPVRIADVAQRFAEHTHPPLEIVYTGLRPGEKLHEELLGQGEPDYRPVHPLISHVPVPPLCLKEADWSSVGGPVTAEQLRQRAEAFPKLTVQ